MGKSATLWPNCKPPIYQEDAMAWEGELREQVKSLWKETRAKARFPKAVSQPQCQFWASEGGLGLPRYLRTERDLCGHGGSEFLGNADWGPSEDP